VLSSRCYQFFCLVVGLERDPIILERINEELLVRKSSCSGLENPYYWSAVGNNYADHVTAVYPYKLALIFSHQPQLVGVFISLAGWKLRSLYVCLFLSVIFRTGFNGQRTEKST
jgi:hypothetical protein